MFINAGGLFDIVKSYRICWIGGKTGGHKTSFAYALAERFLQDGYRLVTNNRCVWADDPRKVQLNSDGMLKSIVIMDEGGRWIKSSAQMEAVLSYPAKMDVIMLIPSYWPPVRTAQVLSVQALFSMRQTGIPAIVYRWSVRLGAFSDNGYFIWIRPNFYYGLYSRRDPGDSAGPIVDWLISRTNEFEAMWGRSRNNGVYDLAKPSEADILNDAVAGFEEAVSQFTSSALSKRSSKFKRQLFGR